MNTMAADQLPYSKNDDNVIDVDLVTDAYLSTWEETIGGMFVEGIDRKILLEDLLKFYTSSLKQQLAIAKDITLLKEKILYHLQFFHLHYTEMNDVFHVSNYYELMEDILAYYCTIEFEIMRRTCRVHKKKQYNAEIKRVTQGILKALTVYLGQREVHMIHVLLKMKYNSMSEPHNQVRKCLYYQILFMEPAREITDEDLCRYKILFLNYKDLMDRNTHRELNKLFFLRFGWQHKVENSEILRTVLQFNPSTEIDAVRKMITLKRDVVVKYFNFMNRKKEQEGSLCNSENVVEDPLREILFGNIPVNEYLPLGPVFLHNEVVVVDDDDNAQNSGSIKKHTPKRTDEVSETTFGNVRYNTSNHSVPNNDVFVIPDDDDENYPVLNTARKGRKSRKSGWHQSKSTNKEPMVVDLTESAPMDKSAGRESVNLDQVESERNERIPTVPVEKVSVKNVSTENVTTENVPRENVSTENVPTENVSMKKQGERLDKAKNTPEVRIEHIPSTPVEKDDMGTGSKDARPARENEHNKESKQIDLKVKEKILPEPAKEESVRAKSSETESESMHLVETESNEPKPSITINHAETKSKKPIPEQAEKSSIKTDDHPEIRVEEEECMLVDPEENDRQPINLDETIVDITNHAETESIPEQVETRSEKSSDHPEIQVEEEECMLVDPEESDSQPIDLEEMIRKPIELNMNIPDVPEVKCMPIEPAENVCESINPEATITKPVDQAESNEHGQHIPESPVEDETYILVDCEPREILSEPIDVTKENDEHTPPIIEERATSHISLEESKPPEANEQLHPTEEHESNEVIPAYHIEKTAETDISELMHILVDDQVDNIIEISSEEVCKNIELILSEPISACVSKEPDVRKTEADTIISCSVVEEKIKSLTINESESVCKPNGKLNNLKIEDATNENIELSLISVELPAEEEKYITTDFIRKPEEVIFKPNGQNISHCIINPVNKHLTKENGSNDLLGQKWLILSLNTEHNKDYSDDSESKRDYEGSRRSKLDEKKVQELEKYLRFNNVPDRGKDSSEDGVYFSDHPILENDIESSASNEDHQDEFDQEFNELCSQQIDTVGKNAKDALASIVIEGYSEKESRGKPQNGKRFYNNYGEMSPLSDYTVDKQMKDDSVYSVTEYGTKVESIFLTPNNSEGKMEDDLIFSPTNGEILPETDQEYMALKKAAVVLDDNAVQGVLKLQTVCPTQLIIENPETNTVTVTSPRSRSKNNVMYTSREKLSDISKNGECHPTPGISSQPPKLKSIIKDPSKSKIEEKFMFTSKQTLSDLNISPHHSNYCGLYDIAVKRDMQKNLSASTKSSIAKKRVFTNDVMLSSPIKTNLINDDLDLLDPKKRYKDLKRQQKMTNETANIPAKVSRIDGKKHITITKEEPELFIFHPTEPILSNCEITDEKVLDSQYGLNNLQVRTERYTPEELLNKFYKKKVDDVDLVNHNTKQRCIRFKYNTDPNTKDVGKLPPTRSSNHELPKPGHSDLLATKWTQRNPRNSSAGNRGKRKRGTGSRGKRRGSSKAADEKTRSNARRT